MDASPTPAMEFHAYPSVSNCGTSKHVIWRAQNILHSSDSLVLPGALLISAIACVMYEHFTLEMYNSTATRNFLVLIILTMLPLAFLEKKVVACADPVGQISKFSSKVMLMHACFLALRLPGFYNSGIDMNNLSSFLGFVVACVLLPMHFGFRSLRSSFHEHRDVWCIIFMGMVAAMLTEVIGAYWGGRLRLIYKYSFYRKAFITSMIENAALYLELLAFVPACWLVCRPASQCAQQSNVVDTRRRAVVFFAFVIGFYFMEDLFSAFSLAFQLPLAALGHTGHFLFLLDFAAFVLAQLFDPEKLEKLMGSLTHWLTDACSV